MKDIESDWSLRSCSCVWVTVRSPSVQFFLLVNDTLLGRHRVSRGRTMVFTGFHVTIEGSGNCQGRGGVRAHKASFGCDVSGTNGAQ